MTRRRPRYGSFLASGALVGLVATAVVILGPGADAERRGQLLFYLAILLAGIGALFGGLAAVLLEGRRGARAEDGPPTTPDP